MWLIKLMFSRLWVSASMERFLMSNWQATLFFQMNTLLAPASVSAVGKSSHLRNHATTVSLFFLKHSLRRTYSLLFKSSGAVWIIIKKVFVCSLLSLPKQFLFNYKYSRNSNIVKWLQFKLFYYSILKCNLFRWWERYIFSSHYSNFHFWSI